MIQGDLPKTFHFTRCEENIEIEYQCDQNGAHLSNNNIARILSNSLLKS